MLVPHSQAQHSRHGSIDRRIKTSCYSSRIVFCSARCILKHPLDCLDDALATLAWYVPLPRGSSNGRGLFSGLGPFVFS